MFIYPAFLFFSFLFFQLLSLPSNILCHGLFPVTLAISISISPICRILDGRRSASCPSTASLSSVCSCSSSAASDWLRCRLSPFSTASLLLLLPLLLSTSHPSLRPSSDVTLFKPNKLSGSAFNHELRCLPPGDRPPNCTSKSTRRPRSLLRCFSSRSLTSSRSSSASSTRNASSSHNRSRQPGAGLVIEVVVVSCRRVDPLAVEVCLIVVLSVVAVSVVPSRGDDR